MRLQSVCATGSIVAALLLAPGMLSAKVQQPSSMSQPMAKSNISGSPHEALTLVRGIRDTSERVATQADELVISNPLAIDSWISQADKLDAIKGDINAMGKELSRLQGLRSTLPAWEQTAVDRAARNLKLMAVHTTDAIDFLNRSHTGLWRPALQNIESALQTEAHDLHHVTGEYLSYSRAYDRENSLARDLHLSTAS